jgi:hypothetical protein
MIEILHGVFSISNMISMLIDFAFLIVFNIGLSLIGLRNIQRHWII